MEIEGKAARRHREALSYMIGGEAAREEFTNIWLTNGRAPGPAIRKRWPVLNESEPVLIAQLWDLPAPRTLTAKKQPVAGVDAQIELIWASIREIQQQLKQEV